MLSSFSNMNALPVLMLRQVYVGGVLDPLGPLLGSLGVLLVLSWRSLGFSWSSLSSLGPSLSFLGAIWRGSGCQKH